MTMRFFKENYYSRKELTEFLACCKQDLPLMKYIAFHLLALSGLCKGELFALTWADVDFDAAILKVNKAGGYSKHEAFILRTQRCQNRAL